MKYIKLTIDKWVVVDEVANTAQVIIKSYTKDELKFNQSQLESLPVPFTTEQKLKWFDENYKDSGSEQSRLLIQQKISELQEILDNLK